MGGINNSSMIAMQGLATRGTGKSARVNPRPGSGPGRISAEQILALRRLTSARRSGGIDR